MESFLRDVRYVIPWDALKLKKERASADWYLTWARDANARVLLSFGVSLAFAAGVPTAVSSAAAMVPVAGGSGMGGALTRERSRRSGPGFHVDVCTAATPSMVKLTAEPSRAQPGRCDSWTT